MIKKVSQEDFDELVAQHKEFTNSIYTFVKSVEGAISGLAMHLKAHEQAIEEIKLQLESAGAEIH